MTQPHLHRLFFALLPPASAKRPIGEQASACAGDKRVPADRLHMTLGITEDFDGFPQEAADRLRELAEGIVAAPVAMTLEKISARGSVVVLLPRRPVAALCDLQDKIEAGMLRRGLLRAGWKFNPHVTLTYRHRGLPFSAKIEPIRWESHDFVLIGSHIGKGLHDQLGRWPLASVQGSLF